MRRFASAFALATITVGCLAAPAEARTEKETAFLAKLHKQNLFPDASDKKLLASGHAFCRDALDVGFAQAYLDGDSDNFTDKQTASFFLLDNAAAHYLCPAVEKAVSK
ncbi:MAG TPA: DUF732 domain-containing protein [Acidimicrobiia bacterium]|jgi:hypothetical protein